MGYDEEGLYLFQDSGWNDYGYFSNFIAILCLPSSLDFSISTIEIGRVLLCPDNSLMKELYNYVTNKDLSDDIELSVTDEMCSCPTSLQYYFRLYRALNENVQQVSNVLKCLGDVTQLSDKIISGYKEKNSIFRCSVLRDDSVCSPNMIRFMEIIERSCGYIGESTSKLNSILEFYDVFSKSDLSVVKRICADFNKCTLEYSFLAPFINRIFEAIEEKEDEDINDKDLCFYELKYTLSDYGESDENDSLLLKVLKYIIDIKKVLLFKWRKDFMEDLGHYTSMKTVPKLISFGKDNYFRFTSASQLNDPLEGKVIFDFLNMAITPSSVSTGVCNNIASESKYTYFIASATSQSDSLPMWKQYTDDADGAYMTFSEEYLERISRIDGMKFGKICYLTYSDQEVTKSIVDGNDNSIVTKRLNQIFQALRQNPQLFNVNNGLITRLTEISFLFKRYEYSYESEYRIFIESNVEDLDSFESDADYMKKADPVDLAVVTEDDGNPIPRLRIAITACPIVYKKIIIGPKAISRDYVEPYVKACYEKNKKIFNSGKNHIRYPDISIEESDIHYR